MGTRHVTRHRALGAGTVGVMASAPTAIWFAHAWHWSIVIAMLYASLLSGGVTLIALNWRRK